MPNSKLFQREDIPFQTSNSNIQKDNYQSTQRQAARDSFNPDVDILRTMTKIKSKDRYKSKLMRNTIHIPIQMQTGSKGYALKIKIGPNSYNAIIDSGATVSAVSFEFQKNDQVLREQHLQNLKTKLQTANGQTLKVHGQIKVPFSINNHSAHFEFLVVDELTAPIILGQDFLLNFESILNFPKQLITLTLPIEDFICSITKTESFNMNEQKQHCQNKKEDAITITPLSTLKPMKTPVKKDKCAISSENSERKEPTIVNENYTKMRNASLKYSNKYHFIVLIIMTMLIITLRYNVTRGHNVLNNYQSKQFQIQEINNVVPFQIIYPKTHTL